MRPRCSLATAWAGKIWRSSLNKSEYHRITRSCCFCRTCQQKEFFIDNLLVRIHFIIEMIRWTGLAPWEFEFPFPASIPQGFMLQGSRAASQSLQARGIGPGRNGCPPCSEVPPSERIESSKQRDVTAGARVSGATRVIFKRNLLLIQRDLARMFDFTHSYT